jgi:deoxyribodipyrimidine photolyase-related protein
MQISLLLPHQLFYPNPALSKSRPVVIARDPLFFKDKEHTAIYHKQKILLHLMSTESYCQELKSYGYRVSILDENQIMTPNYYENYLKENNITEVHYIEPHDYIVEKRLVYGLKKLDIKFHRHETPGFINTKDEINEYFSTKKKLFLSSFYQGERKKLNILVDSEGKPERGKWSFDSENRKKLPKKIDIPSLHKQKYDKSIHQNSLKHISDNYGKNYGGLDSFNYPVNREQAKQSLFFFLENRFKNFGAYEDAISTEHRFIFHSVLSPALNIGLLTPMEVINTSIEYANENDIPINSLEGFIRQIIGWREFIRGVYQTKGSYQRNSNYWNFTKKIPSSFYKGNTGIKPVDDTIKNVMKNAYGHHIERLMILGNIMCLLRYDPNDIYKWFMELFIDSYDWVMVPNIYGMSQFADGGLMSTKPYISGSNYILKMSDYKKGEWSLVWDALYWNFIRDFRSFFEKNPRMSMMTKLYDKKSSDQKISYDQVINSIDL